MSVARSASDLKHAFGAHVAHLPIGSQSGYCPVVAQQVLLPNVALQVDVRVPKPCTTYGLARQVYQSLRLEVRNKYCADLVHAAWQQAAGYETYEQSFTEDPDAQ